MAGVYRFAAQAFGVPCLRASYNAVPGLQSATCEVEIIARGDIHRLLRIDPIVMSYEQMASYLSEGVENNAVVLEGDMLIASGGGLPAVTELIFKQTIDGKESNTVTIKPLFIAPDGVQVVRYLGSRNTYLLRISLVDIRYFWAEYGVVALEANKRGEDGEYLESTLKGYATVGILEPYRWKDLFEEVRYRLPGNIKIEFEGAASKNISSPADHIVWDFISPKEALQELLDVLDVTCWLSFDSKALHIVPRISRRGNLSLLCEDNNELRNCVKVEDRYVGGPDYRPTAMVVVGDVPKVDHVVGSVSLPIQDPINPSIDRNRPLPFISPALMVGIDPDTGEYAKAEEVLNKYGLSDMIELGKFALLSSGAIASQKEVRTAYIAFKKFGSTPTEEEWIKAAKLSALLERWAFRLYHIQVWSLAVLPILSRIVKDPLGRPLPNQIIAATFMPVENKNLEDADLTDISQEDLWVVPPVRFKNFIIKDFSLEASIDSNTGIITFPEPVGLVVKETVAATIPREGFNIVPEEVSPFTPSDLPAGIVSNEEIDRILASQESAKVKRTVSGLSTFGLTLFPSPLVLAKVTTRASHYGIVLSGDWDSLPTDAGQLVDISRQLFDLTKHEGDTARARRLAISFRDGGITTASRFSAYVQRVGADKVEIGLKGFEESIHNLILHRKRDVIPYLVRDEALELLTVVESNFPVWRRVSNRDQLLKAIKDRAMRTLRRPDAEPESTIGYVVKYAGFLPIEEEDWDDWGVTNMQYRLDSTETSSLGTTTLVFNNTRISIDGRPTVRDYQLMIESQKALKNPPFLKRSPLFGG